MAECAWHCGDPGVQYDTTINRWHTCPNSGRINASNPCSEYMFLDDTACNLASINLMKFRNDDGTFDVERFKAACRIFFIAQEILVDHASYPTSESPTTATCSGRSGLGYSNLGSLLMTGGIPYDSDAARGLCGAVTALLHGAANLTSIELAAAVGPFDTFREKSRADAARDANASRCRRGNRPRLPGLFERCSPRTVGRCARQAAGSSASATRKPPCSPRPARSAS